MLLLGIPLVMVTERLTSVFGWFGTRWKKFATCRRYSKSLSLVFSFFSLLAGNMRCSGSRGLKAERGAVVVSRGIYETRRSEFFFLFLFFFSGHYII